MLKVFKFGGASVKSVEGINNVVSIVRDEIAEGSKLVVVVSAMGKTTNALERLVSLSLAGDEELMYRQLNDIRDYHHSIISKLFSNQETTGFVPGLNTISKMSVESMVEGLLYDVQLLCKKANIDHPDYDFFYDSIVSYGELISTTIVSAAMKNSGVDNVLLDMTQLLVTDCTFREAKPNIECSSTLLNDYLSSHPAEVYVAQGFIGGTIDGAKTTLGREGSDYSAALIANMLGAQSVTIWKDVDGVLNADPRLIENTTLIPELSYSDAVELAYSGAQVIHPKTIRPLENKHIPLYVKPFDNSSASGSVICDKTTKSIDVPVFIFRKNQVLITLRAKDFSFVLEDSLNQLFEIIYRHRLKVSLIQSSAITISVCVDKSRYLEGALTELSSDYKVTFNENLSLLTIRGTTPEIIEQQTKDRTILLSQTTRRTARFVFVQD